MDEGSGGGEPRWLEQKFDEHGREIQMYQRRRFRKNKNANKEPTMDICSRTSNNDNKGVSNKEEGVVSAGVGARLHSKQHQSPLVEPPPVKTTIVVADWANANSGHLLTCACRVCTGVVSTPLFRSNIIAYPSQPLDNTLQAQRKQLLRMGGSTKLSQAKVFPSIVIPASSENQKTGDREISLPPLEDISFIELLASGDNSEEQRATSSQPSISFMDTLRNDKLKKRNERFTGVSTTLSLWPSSNKNEVLAAESELAAKKTGNRFVKMVMEEEGVDDEKLLMEVKEELMIREVDAYACLLRKQNLDFGKLARTMNSSSER